MEKFTPGPWQAHVGKSRIGIWAQGGGAVAFVTFSQEQCRDNANLMAAAPNLYAALEALIHGIDTVQLPAETAHAKFALAKARGEA